jgi:hypothetical protein
MQGSALPAIFFVLFILLLLALGISKFIDARKPGQPVGQMFFALLYIIGALVMVVYKINN